MDGYRVYQDLSGPKANLRLFSSHIDLRPSALGG